jgi:hypothetical protein
MADDDLTFHDAPDDFPAVWEADEEEIEVRVNIDNIINKHVFLAIQEYMKDDCWILFSPVTYGLDETIICEITIGLGDHAQRTFNLENDIERLGERMYSAEEFLGMAQSLERAAQTLRRFADGQRPKPEGA